jgi:hypothetical protein
MRAFLILAVVTLFMGIAAPAHAVWKEVQGTLRFADYEQDGTTFRGNRPIRYVKVTLKTGSTFLGTVTTSSTGEFATSVDPALLNAGPITIEFQSKNYAADVYLDLDWENDRITWKATFPFVVTNGPLNLSATVSRANFAAQFNILDAITEGREYANARREEQDAITQVDVQYPDAEGSNYSIIWDEITLSGPSAYGYGGNSVDESDDVSALHEYGHHLEDHIGYIEWADGYHEWCTNRGYRFSWLEGFPEVFARAVARAKFPAVVTQAEAFEPTPSCATWPTELWTVAALYDVLDGANESWDRINGNQVAGGFPLSDYVFKVFDKTEPASIHGFHNGWVGRNLYPDAHVDLDRILDHHHSLEHALADFKVNNASTPSAVSPGSSFNVWANLGNPGYGYENETVRVRAYAIGMSGPVYVVDTTIAAFQGNTGVSLPAQLPSNFPLGTYNLTITLDPLDRIPESNETNNSFVTPLKVAVCGNGVCSGGETYSTCPADCAPPVVICGDGTCAPSEQLSCEADCGDGLPPICKIKPYLPVCQ